MNVLKTFRSSSGGGGLKHRGRRSWPGRKASTGWVDCLSIIMVIVNIHPSCNTCHNDPKPLGPSPKQALQAPRPKHSHNFCLHYIFICRFPGQPSLPWGCKGWAQWTRLTSISYFCQSNVPDQILADLSALYHLHQLVITLRRLQPHNLVNFLFKMDRPLHGQW